MTTIGMIKHNELNKDYSADLKNNLNKVSNNIDDSLSSLPTKILNSTKEWDKKLDPNVINANSINDTQAELKSYSNDINHLMATNANYKANANGYKEQFNHFNSLLANNQPGSAARLATNIQGQLSNPPVNYGVVIDDMAANNASFFALLIQVMLYCYNSTAEYGKLVLLKQKDGNQAADKLTQMQKFFLELKGLVNDGSLVDAEGKSVQDLYGLFSLAFKNNPPQTDSEKKANNVLSKYQDLLSSVKDPTGNSYFSSMTWKGNDIDKFPLMMNGVIDEVNKQLKANGVADSMAISHFDDKDPRIIFGSKKSDSSNYPIVDFFDTQNKSCESASSQLTTINQNTQATANQATETVKSLLEWLKQAITGYGTSVNPR